MSRPLLLAALVSLSTGCLGYRNTASGGSRTPQQQQTAGYGYGAPAPGYAAPTSGYGAPTPPVAQPQQAAPVPDPVTAMVGTAWTLFGMMTQGMPAPAPGSAPAPQPPAPQPAPTTPTPVAWPFPFPLPTMTSGLPLPPAPGAPASTGSAPADWARFEDEVLALTNQRRAQGATCGTQTFAPVGPLVANPQLRQAARGHAADMGNRDYFDHQSPEGKSPGDRTRAAGFSSSFVGENIAAGYTSPEAVMAGWMKSPGHCSNIMDGGYTMLGVGYASVPKSSMTEYWVQNFGASR